MSFNFFRASHKAQDNNLQDGSSKAGDKALAAEKDVISAKTSTADKKTASEKESSADDKQEDERQDLFKQESNSKVECRNCKQTTVILYDGDEDEKGEPTVSRMHCLNCGFTFSYFPKFEKEEKEREDSLNWNAGFMILVAMLFTIIAIKGDDGGLFPRSEPATVESIDESDSLRSPQPDPFTTEPFPNEPSAVRVLNDAEPFEIDRNN